MQQEHLITIPHMVSTDTIEGGPQYYMMMKVLTLYKASFNSTPAGKRRNVSLPDGIKVHAVHVVSTNKRKRQL